MAHRFLRTLRLPVLVLFTIGLVEFGPTVAGQAPPPADERFVEAMSRGEAALRARKYDAALDAFKQANAMQAKKSPEALFGIARAYHGLEAFKSEADACAEALKCVGDNNRLTATLHNQRGMAFFSLADKTTAKEIKDAETEFRAALVLAEAPPIAWYNLGVVLMKQNRDAEGVAAMQAYLESGVKAPEIELAKKIIGNPRRARERFAPDYSFTSLKGEYVQSQDLAGKTVLLDFWGTWCGPCRRATPDLVRFYKKYAGPNFEMIGISSDSGNDRQKLVDYIEQNKMEWPQFHDVNKQIIRTYSINAYPTYFVVDAEGIVRTEIRGWGMDTISRIDGEVKKSLKAAQKSGFQILQPPAR